MGQFTDGMADWVINRTTNLEQAPQDRVKKKTSENNNNDTTTPILQ